MSAWSWATRYLALKVKSFTILRARKYDPGDDGGNRRPHRKRKPERLEVGGQQQEDDTHRHQESQTQASEHLRHRLDLPAHCYIHPIGRLSRIFDSLLHAGCRASEILTRGVCAQCQHALHVVAVIFAERCTVGNAGHVAEVDLSARPVADAVPAAGKLQTKPESCLQRRRIQSARRAQLVKEGEDRRHFRPLRIKGGSARLLERPHPAATKPPRRRKMW